MAELEADRSRLEGARVLVVDDEAALRAPVARFLRRCGAWVTEAGDGAHALRRIEREVFDAVVSDVRMPVMDGFALLAELERRRSPMARRLVFVTGDEMALLVLRRDPALAGRVLSKPADLPALEAAIAAAVCSAAAENSTSARAAAGR